MSQTSTMPTIYYADAKEQAAFSVQGPQPRFLLDSQHFKVVLVGLEAGQQIPPHPESLAMYHVLEGTGVMVVNDQRLALQPGATVLTPAGASRGVLADTRLVFLAAKPG